MSERLDIEVFKRGIGVSREKAKAMIENGNIAVNGKVITKASFKVDAEASVDVVGEVMPYVSRGGLKLEKAIDVFGINLKNKTAVDMGASTGGFTDCMLQNGISKVYAVDVGSGQLSEKIRENPKVINMENTNIRNMTFGDIGEKVDFISIDTSFISLKLILPTAFMFLKDDGEIVALVKPQFEAGRTNLGKNGIVKDKKVHISVLKDIYSFVISSGFCPENITVSPITGGDGNIEFLIHIIKKGVPFLGTEINKVVEEY